MFRQLTKPILLTGLFCVTAFSAPVALRAADVSDGGGFFSAAAVAKANEAIRALEQKSGHEVRIETFATVPDGKSQRVSAMDAKERETFFSNWLHDRAEATKSRGIVILICKEPAHLRLWAGKPLERVGFGIAQAKPIRETLLTGFKAKDYDKALSDTVTRIATVFDGLHAARGGAVARGNAAHPAPHRAQLPPHPGQPVQQTSGYGGLVFVIAIVIGAIVVISLISRLFGSGQTGGGYGGGYGGGGGFGGGGFGGGGGFMRGLAGGIFGAMAGNWLYDQFSGRHAHGNDSNWTGSDSSINGGDGGSSNSDGGFDGGTDFGGGDFGGGGGDAGGGDF